MKLIKISHKLQSRSLTRPSYIELCFKIIAPFILLTLISIGLWLLGSSHFKNLPISQVDKKLYIIISLWLLWILKFLIYDLDKPFLKTLDPLQNHLQELQNRFQGAYKFLKKATLLRYGKTVHLTTLPWYLFIGSNSAGKTTLLARSEVNFILQRQFHAEQLEALPVTEYCDFWVTRDICIVDVPGKYIQPSDMAHQSALPPAQYASIWGFLLRLIKKYRGKHAIKGVIIALPLPELILQHDTETYHLYLQELLERIIELQKIFAYSLSLHLVITKCDLLPGFSEFFADTSSEEIVQNWGVALAQVKKAAVYDLFADRFNALIKKLNQQLLWRLHQERNPLARPYIKDFPLQVERVKEAILQFIKKLTSAQLNISLQGVYLTSALQDKKQQDSQIIDDVNNTTERALQIFEQPIAPSRVYFVKQLLTQVLSGTPIKTSIAINTNLWQYRGSIILASVFITGVAILLGKDFERGVKQTYVVQNQLTEYKLTLEQFHNPDEHLVKTLNLLDSLDNSAKLNHAKLNFLNLGTFYSHKSQERTNLAYHQSLQTILLPEIKNYFEEHLQNPVNETTENVYAMMKAYLMLGDTTHFQANFVLETLKKILPNSMSENDLNRLSKHLKIALIAWQPLSLDANTIQQTRSYLTSLSDIKLSYIILKNITNNMENTLSLLNADKKTVFKNKELYNEIPSMFTAKTFLNIFSQGTVAASQEAVFGNWILGTIPGINKNKDTAETLAKQLRVTYVTHYITVWENVLNNVSIIEPKDLSQVDSMLLALTSDGSPLVQLLHTFHENTYFDPIASSSTLLQNVGILFDKHNQSDNQLNQILGSLKALHELVHNVITAENQQKAAFEVISNRAKDPANIDAISALRLVAQKSPEPIKHWLDKIANDTWRFLMKEGIHYIDISWQEKVIRNYETDIANRYPFSNKTQHEVNFAQFINFFGNPGIITNFYNDFLKILVDTSSTQWHWKNINENKLPLSEETLKQIQQAMRIQHTFFPNGDTKPFIQFALTPYRFDKRIKSVKLSINDKEITDKISDAKNQQHFIAWPSITKWNAKWTMTSVQLTMVNDKMIIRDYPGVWGWFKLINQSFENAFSENQMLINLSSKNYEPVRYLLTTQNQGNPFLSLNLHHFHLSQQITDNKA